MDNTDNLDPTILERLCIQTVDGRLSDEEALTMLAKEQKRSGER